MTLKELAKQYYEDEKMLTGLIDELREKSKNYVGAKKHTANRQLFCLYEMRRDVRLTAQTLDTYYDNVPKKRIYHRRQSEV